MRQMRTVISIPSELHQKLKVACAIKSVNITDAATEAVLNWLKDKPKDEGREKRRKAA